jgi:hypothetical protein
MSWSSDSTCRAAPAAQLYTLNVSRVAPAVAIRRFAPRCSAAAPEAVTGRSSLAPFGAGGCLCVYLFTPSAGRSSAVAFESDPRVCLYTLRKRLRREGSELEAIDHVGSVGMPGGSPDV